MKIKRIVGTAALSAAMAVTAVAPAAHAATDGLKPRTSFTDRVNTAFGAPYQGRLFWNPRVGSTICVELISNVPGGEAWYVRLAIQTYWSAISPLHDLVLTSGDRKKCFVVTARYRNDRYVSSVGRKMHFLYGSSNLARARKATFKVTYRPV